MIENYAQKNYNNKSAVEVNKILNVRITKAEGLDLLEMKLQNIGLQYKDLP
jgi:hypothetical protein